MSSPPAFVHFYFFPLRASLPLFVHLFILLVGRPAAAVSLCPRGRWHGFSGPAVGYRPLSIVVFFFFFVLVPLFLFRERCLGLVCTDLPRVRLHAAVPAGVPTYFTLENRHDGHLRRRVYSRGVLIRGGLGCNKVLIEVLHIIFCYTYINKFNVIYSVA